MSLYIDQNLNGAMETLLTTKDSSKSELKLKRFQVKGLIMLSKTLVLVMCLSMSVGAFAAKTGAGSGGGGFSYYYKSGKAYSQVKKYLAKVLSDASEAELSAIEKKYKRSIDWNEFINIIKTAKAEPKRSAERQNPDGFTDPLIMDYDTKTRTISALDLFFLEYNTEKITSAEVQEISRLILHETSHLFEIGINNDDEVSKKFSEDLNKIVFKYLYRCNNDLGQGAAKVLECNYEKEDKGERVKEIVYKFTGLNGNNGFLCQSRVDIFREAVNGYEAIGVLDKEEKFNGRISTFMVKHLDPGTILAVKHLCLLLNENDDVNAQLVEVSENGSQRVLTSKTFKVREDYENVLFIKNQLYKTDSGDFRN